MAKGENQYVSFSRSIDDFVKKTGLKATTVLRKVALDAFAGVLLRSPVDTGRFRSNWRIGINKIDFRTTVGVRARSQGATGGGGMTRGETAEGRARINRAVFGNTIFITNNLPYAGRLERGHSKQAPRGVLRVTFQDVRASLNAAVRAAKALP